MSDEKPTVPAPQCPHDRAALATLIEYAEEQRSAEKRYQRAFAKLKQEGLI